MIIGLIGNTRVGKDTLANYLVNNYGFIKFSFADKIKKIAAEIFDWDYNTLQGDGKDNIDYETGIKPREFYKWFGTDIMQFDFDNEFTNHNIPKRAIWAYSLMKKIKKELNLYSNKNIVITDFRFKHEYDLFIKYFDNIKFILLINQDLNYKQTFNINYWQYEIESILLQINQKIRNKHYNLLNNLNSNIDTNFDDLLKDKYLYYIKNINTIDILYNNIDNIMNNFNINKNNFNNDLDTFNSYNLKNIQHC
jgi:hypothetical protein